MSHSDTESHRGLLIAINHSVPTVRTIQCLAVHGSILVVRAVCKPPLRDLLIINYHGRHLYHDTERLNIIIDTIHKFYGILR